MYYVSDHEWSLDNMIRVTKDNVGIIQGTKIIIQFILVSINKKGHEKVIFTYEKRSYVIVNTTKVVTSGMVRREKVKFKKIHLKIKALKPIINNKLI